MEHVPEVLWAYRTTTRSVNQEMPFALAFGTETVALLEIGIPFPRTKLSEYEHNDELLRLNLDFLDENRDRAL